MSKTQTENKDVTQNNDVLKSQANKLIMAIDLLKNNMSNMPKASPMDYAQKAENKFNRVETIFNSGVVKAKVETSKVNEIQKDGTIKVKSIKQEFYGNKEALANEIESEVLNKTGITINLLDVSKVSDNAKGFFYEMVNKDLSKRLKTKLN